MTAGGDDIENNEKIYYADNIDGTLMTSIVDTDSNTNVLNI